MPMYTTYYTSICYTFCVPLWMLVCRWKHMPKHIKICKHPDTQRFYVSDVTDFQSVWVSAYLSPVQGTLHPLPSSGASELLPGQLFGHQFPWRGHHTAGPLQRCRDPRPRHLKPRSPSPAPFPLPPTPPFSPATPRKGNMGRGSLHLLLRVS